MNEPTIALPHICAAEQWHGDRHTETNEAVNHRVSYLRMDSCASSGASVGVCWHSSGHLAVQLWSWARLACIYPPRANLPPYFHCCHEPSSRPSCHHLSPRPPASWSPGLSEAHWLPSSLTSPSRPFWESVVSFWILIPSYLDYFFFFLGGFFGVFFVIWTFLYSS